VNNLPDILVSTATTSERTVDRLVELSVRQHDNGDVIVARFIRLVLKEDGTILSASPVPPVKRQVDEVKNANVSAAIDLLSNRAVAWLAKDRESIV